MNEENKIVDVEATEVPADVEAAPVAPSEEVQAEVKADVQEVTA